MKKNLPIYESVWFVLFGYGGGVTIICILPALACLPLDHATMVMVIAAFLASFLVGLAASWAYVYAIAVADFFEQGHDPFIKGKFEAHSYCLNPVSADVCEVFWAQQRGPYSRFIVAYVVARAMAFGTELRSRLTQEGINFGVKEVS